MLSKKTVIPLTAVLVVLISLTVYIYFEEPETSVIEDVEECSQIRDDIERQKCVITVAGNQDSLEKCDEVEEGFDDFKIICETRINQEVDNCEEIDDEELSSMCYRLTEQRNSTLG